MWSGLKEIKASWKSHISYKRSFGCIFCNNYAYERSKFKLDSAVTYEDKTKFHFEHFLDRYKLAAGVESFFNTHYWNTAGRILQRSHSSQPFDLNNTFHWKNKIIEAMKTFYFGKSKLKKNTSSEQDFNGSLDFYSMSVKDETGEDFGSDRLKEDEGVGNDSGAENLKKKNSNVFAKHQGDFHGGSNLELSNHRDSDIDFSNHGDGDEDLGGLGNSDLDLRNNEDNLSLPESFDQEHDLKGSDLEESDHDGIDLEESDLEESDLVDNVCDDIGSSHVESNLSESLIDDIFHGDFGTEWEVEFQGLKEMLQCSDKQLVKLVIKYPRLKNIEVFRTLKENARILLEKGISRKKVYKKLISTYGLFLQISPADLRTFFLCRGKMRDWVYDLQIYLVLSLKGDIEAENVQYLASILNVKYSVIKTVNKHFICAKINEYFVFLLKEKIDFLRHEGLTDEDIAYHLELLTMSMIYLGPKLAEMKNTLGEVWIPTLKTQYFQRIVSRDYPSRNKLFHLLESSYKEFTPLQRIYLNNVYQTDAINIILYLFEKEIDKKDIIQNPYLLGHDFKKFRDCFEKRVKMADLETIQSRRNFLNLVVYDLEFSN